MLRRLFATAALIITALSAPTVEAQQSWRVGVLAYELDSDADIYCTSSSSDWVTGTSQIETSGSSTTTVASNASTDTPFDAISVGDHIQAGGLVRRVTAKASATSITVSAAWNLGTAGVGWQYLHYTCGTTTADGWMSIAQFTSWDVCVEIEQMNATGIGVRFEAMTGVPLTNPVHLYPPTSGTTAACGQGTQASGYCSFTAAGASSRLCYSSTAPFAAVRVALNIDTDDGGDTGANAESINVYVLGRR